MKNIKARNVSGDSWKTPDSFLEKYNLQNHFDPCPFEHNLEEFDGLKINWKEYNFINPPYSRILKEKFILKAIEESKKGKNCVMLLPVATDTKIFHEHILPNKKDIIFIKGRIKFAGWNSKGEWVDNQCGQHGSMLVIF